MNEINHYDLSRVLGSQIVGKVAVGHGQLEASRTLRSLRSIPSRSAIECREDRYAETIDAQRVYKVFLDLRTGRGDLSSPDLYIADDERNAQLVKAWRDNGVAGSIRQLNHCLMNGRKQSKLTGLDSKKHEIPRDVKERLQFVCEFAATKLRYERGASVDDIICCPELSREFHSRCTRIIPDYKWLDYRWTILSVRKSGRHNKLSKKHPPLDLVKSPILLDKSVDINNVESLVNAIPETSGVFSLVEGDRDLYIVGTNGLRTSIEYHAQPRILDIAKSTFWRPTKPFAFKYCEVAKPHVKQAEEWLIRNRQPVFNVPRSAA